MGPDTYPATRAEAKASGASHYYTGVPCSRGHKALRKTKGACVECTREDAAAAYSRRTTYFQEYNRNPVVRERRHEWYLKHRDEVVSRATSRPAELKRQYRKAWKDANPDKVRAYTNSRRRRHREATPKWLTARQRDAMRQLYRIAHTASKLTGTKYVVDHICPLQGANSCGLHVPWNLRVITQEENAAKHDAEPQTALAFPDAFKYA